MKIAIAIENTSNDWVGGLNYFRNLVYSINTTPDLDIRIVLVTGRQTDLKGLDEHAEVIRSALLDIGAPLRTLRKGIQKFMKADYLLYRLLQKHDIALLSHSGYLGRGIPIPSLPWIADFQHRHLPDVFSADEIAKRDHRYAEYARFGSAVLLSSHCAEKDLQAFIAPATVDSHVLRFSSCMAHDIQWPEREAIREKYALPEKWFHLPNQFWAHKNHRVVIEALAQQADDTLCVALTGNPHDARNPDFYPSLMRRVEECRIQDRFRVLGMIPYADMLALMRYAVAVINPSHFEGWSTSVEEGRALGKKVIMSDIPVHLEQSPERGDFFAVDDGRDLLAKMTAAEQDFDPDREEQFVQTAIASLEERRTRFARNFQDIVFRVLADDHG